MKIRNQRLSEKEHNDERKLLEKVRNTPAENFQQKYERLKVYYDYIIMSEKNRQSNKKHQNAINKLINKM